MQPVSEEASIGVRGRFSAVEHRLVPGGLATVMVVLVALCGAVTVCRGWRIDSGSTSDVGCFLGCRGSNRCAGGCFPLVRLRHRGRGSVVGGMGTICGRLHWNSTAAAEPEALLSVTGLDPRCLACGRAAVLAVVVALGSTVVC